MLQYQPHPNPQAAAQGLIICTLDNCVIGGVGKTPEEALQNFCLSINRLEAGRQLVVQGCLISEGKMPIPAPVPVEQASEPLIIQTGITPDQLAKLKSAAAQS